MQKTILYIEEKLNLIFSKKEIQFLSALIFEEICEFSKIDMLLKEKKCSISDFEKIKKIIVRLQKNEPIDYILGKTKFYNLDFFVNKDVLIPRPETEELVDLIIKKFDKNKNLKILDIGTGSACIAVTLAKHFQNAEIEAWDISRKALEIAQKNAQKNDVNILFKEKNILTENGTFFKKNWDIIISNPPYVRLSEKIMMKKNVINFEPHQAIFVNDEKPLIFYEKISDFARINLKENGYLFFEINEFLADKMIDLLKNKSFKNIQLKKDFFEKNRIIFANYG